MMEWVTNNGSGTAGRFLQRFPGRTFSRIRGSGLWLKPGLGSVDPVACTRRPASLTGCTRDMENARKRLADQLDGAGRGGKRAEREIEQELRILRRPDEHA